VQVEPRGSNADGSGDGVADVELQVDKRTAYAGATGEFEFG